MILCRKKWFQGLDQIASNGCSSKGNNALARLSCICTLMTVLAVSPFKLLYNPSTFPVGAASFSFLLFLLSSLFLVMLILPSRGAIPQTYEYIYLWARKTSWSWYNSPFQVFFLASGFSFLMSKRVVLHSSGSGVLVNYELFGLWASVVFFFFLLLFKRTHFLASRVYTGCILSM